MKSIEEDSKVGGRLPRKPVPTGKHESEEEKKKTYPANNGYF